MNANYPTILRITVIAASAIVGAPAIAAADDKPLDFAHQIAPIFRTHCIKCHTGDKKQGSFSLNTRADLLRGGESGPAVVVGKSQASDLIKRIASSDADLRMPPEGATVPAEQVALLKRWIDAGLPWDEGFAFVAPSYEPPLKPRRVTLPPAIDGHSNPIDRILDAYLAERNLPRPQPIDDAAFARRVQLDLIGLLPTPEELDAFIADAGSDKRARLVARLLADDTAYAEHWLSFWNDLLRNDYTGTGFITGGRKQISRWLYDSLAANKPFDQFARELIAPPTPESAGFADGIRWRGDVSAGQTVEIQFAQSVGQAFLGINLKCASCHDSFIDRWTLDESYGLAAVYAADTLEIHRCDKPIGRKAQAAWLFPEIGQVDAKAGRTERLEQLAALLTHPENGRFTRTIVNRLWHRMMGRGIVHPTDAMQTEPWNADLLDFLAEDFREHHYDIKHTIRQIAESEAYRGRVQSVVPQADDEAYVYAGPRTKRLTAEQFVDAVWQITGAAPANFDAPILRGTIDPEAASKEKLTSRWIWGHADAETSPAGETFTFRGQRTLKQAPRQAVAVVSCDNSFTLFVNGKQVADGNQWQSVRPIALTPHLRAGANEVLIVATNGGNGPNPAGLFFEARIQQADGSTHRWASDESWQRTTEKPDARGRFVDRKNKDVPLMPDWQPAVVVQNPSWGVKLDRDLLAGLLQGSAGGDRMVRAALVKSDFLMRSLGRPNRDQIVSVRPTELTTLEAIDLSNGQILADALARGGAKLAAQYERNPNELIRHVFRFALSREPTADESSSARALLGDAPVSQQVEDLLWAVFMLPEFQLVR